MKVCTAPSAAPRHVMERATPGFTVGLPAVVPLQNLGDLISLIQHYQARLPGCRNGFFDLDVGHDDEDIANTAPHTLSVARSRRPNHTGALPRQKKLRVPTPGSRHAPP